MADLGTPVDMGLNTLLHEPYGSGKVIDWNDKLSGTISLDAVPAIMRVSVLDRSDNYVISGMSKADGTWSFIAMNKTLVDDRPLKVIGHDDSGTNANAFVQDFVYTVA